MHGILDHMPYVPIKFTSIVSGGFPPYQWFWDFGNGNTSNEQSPTQSYYETGIYRGSVKVVDKHGKTDTQPLVICINNDLSDIFRVMGFSSEPSIGLVGMEMNFFILIDPFNGSYGVSVVCNF